MMTTTVEGIELGRVDGRFTENKIVNLGKPPYRHEKYVHINYIIVLFLLRPIYEIIRFFLNYFSNTPENSLAYVQLLSVFLLFLKFRRSKKFFLIWLYFLANTFLFYGDYNNNAAQGIIFVLCLVSLYYLPSVTLDGKSLKVFDRFVVGFAYTYAITYFVTVLFFEGMTYNAGLDRTYFNGFVIGHSFSYTVITLGYYVAKRVSLVAAIPLFVSSLSSGTRVGFIVLVVTILFLFLGGRQISSRRLMALIASVTILFASLMILRSYIDPLNDMLRTFEQFSITQFSFETSDTQTVGFTASRTIIWSNAILEMSEYGPEMLRFWFGGGPQSAMDFNEATMNARIWMHNDLIHIMFTYGLVGMVLYLSVIIRYYRKTRSKYLISIFGIAALTNGFFTYDILSMLIPITLLGAGSVDSERKSVPLAVR